MYSAGSFLQSTIWHLTTRKDRGQPHHPKRLRGVWGKTWEWKQDKSLKGALILICPNYNIPMMIFCISYQWEVGRRNQIDNADSGTDTYSSMTADKSMSGVAHKWDEDKCIGAQLARSKPYAWPSMSLLWMILQCIQPPPHSTSPQWLWQSLMEGWPCAGSYACLFFGRGKWWTGFASCRELTEEKTHEGLCQTMQATKRASVMKPIYKPQCCVQPQLALQPK